MREVKVRMLQRGLKMKLNEEEWQLSNILYSNAALLIAENEKELRKLVSEFNEVCKRTKLGVNAEKCKVL